MINDVVSVIIPAYNAGKYLAATVRSLQEQEYPALEIIIINDGSTDDTEAVAKTFISDPRVKYISQENKGCSGAKNTGLQAATGGFIQYLDADDLLSPDKISRQMAILSAQPGRIAVCRTRAFFDKTDEPAGAEIDTGFLYSTDDMMGFLLNLYGLNGPNGMIQPNAFLIPAALAETIGPWDMSISPSPDEDGEYFCRAMLAAKGILFTEQGMNYYRKHLGQKNSLSRQVSPRHAGGALRSLQLVTRHLLAKEDTQRVRDIMARHFAGFIYSYSTYKELVKEARKEILLLKVQRVPLAGGKNFRRLAKWIGFDNALLLKNLLGSK